MHDDKKFMLVYRIWQVLFIVLCVIHLSISIIFFPYNPLSIIYIICIGMITVLAWCLVVIELKESKKFKAVMLSITPAIIWTVILLVVIFRTFVI